MELVNYSRFYFAEEKFQLNRYNKFVGLSRLETLFPTPLQYIYLYRQDDVRQAISLARAEQTDQWMWDHPMRREPRYNYYQILSCLREIRIHQKGWETYFSERGIQPFRVIYEDFVEDIDRTILRIFAYLGIQIPSDFQLSQPILHKQADAFTEDWVDRFQAEQ